MDLERGAGPKESSRPDRNASGQVKFKYFL